MCAFIHFWSGHGLLFDPQFTAAEDPDAAPVAVAAADSAADALGAGVLSLAAADAVAEGVADALAVGCGVIPP